MAKIPNLADESFTNAQSGISLRYKLYGTKIIAQEKERNFKRMLRQRLEMFKKYVAKNIKTEYYEYMNSCSYIVLNLEET